jgi:hypothetical protein
MAEKREAQRKVAGLVLGKETSERAKWRSSWAASPTAELVEPTYRVLRKTHYDDDTK